MTVQLFCGDCLERMKEIPDGSADMVLCDLPYGTTACKWDSVIPFEPLWAQYRRVAKRNAAIVLTASQPFTTALIASNMGMFRYSWVWEKELGVNFMSAKRQPLKVHEDVLVFYTDLAEQRGAAVEYAPLREYFQTERAKSGLSLQEVQAVLGNYMASHYFTNGVQFCIPSEDNYAKLQTTGYFQRPYDEIRAEYRRLGESIKPVTYNPQMTTGKPYSQKQGRNAEVYGGDNGKDIVTVNNGERYPRSVVSIKRQTGLHPTQKPVALMEYLIKTYTNEGETVLDNCMGSGTTGVACVNTNRNFIGIEKDPQYFEIAKERIAEAERRKNDESFVKKPTEPTLFDSMLEDKQ